MTPERIKKLRELAERGVGGERENARSMLTKAGIDWRKPTEPERQTFTFNYQNFNNANTEFEIPISKSSDLLLVSVIVDKLNIKNRTLKIISGKIILRCTHAENVLIFLHFSRMQKDFHEKMWAYASNTTTHLY